MEQNKKFPPEKRELIILENEVIKEPKETMDFTFDSLHGLFINKGLQDLASNVNYDFFTNANRISPRTPWIKDVMYINALDASPQFSLNNNEKDESRYTVFPKYENGIFPGVTVQDLFELTFCNKVVWSNVTLLIKVSVVPGTIRTGRTDRGTYGSITVYEDVPISLEDIQYTISIKSQWRSSEENFAVQCTAETQTISLVLPEAWPGDTLTLGINNPKIESLSFHYAKIIRWDD